MTAVSRLGYLGFEVSDMPAWERLLVDVLGLVVSERRPDGSIALRVDDRAQRVLLHPGERDDVLYIGFELDDEASLDRLAGELSGAGIRAAKASEDLARARRVRRLWQTEDPNGVPIELFCGPDLAREPFRSALVPSGFVTGAEGLGHAVLATRDPEASERFYCDRLGMRLSDHVVAEMAPGFSLRITFLHANPRHHTVAFAHAPLPKRMHHFMLEVGAMDDVGTAYDRCLAAGVPIANGLGVHPNDRMFSFYVHTPSGLDLEFGWGGRKIDDATWKTATYDRTSVWGHRPPAAR
jgi:2,3-dihydroxybiphenyl 1,2-dioxygenase